MNKINKRYKIPSGSEKKEIPSDQTLQEGPKKHNLNSSIKGRSNYEGVYKSNIPRPKNDINKAKPSKYNQPVGYYRNSNKSNITKRKSSPINKFTPKNEDQRKNFEFDYDEGRYSSDKKLSDGIDGDRHQISMNHSIK